MEDVIVKFNEDKEAILNGESWTYTDSLNLANVLNQRHDRILERIRDILTSYKIQKDDSHFKRDSSEVTENTEFINMHTDFTYSQCYYRNSQNKLQPYYKMSKDLLVLVVFSFKKLKNAQTLQKMYIAQFNKMEKELQWWRARYLGIDVRNNLTDAVKDFVPNADYRDYIAFTDLVYITLFGSKATKIRKIFGLKDKTNLRPLLSDKCLEDVKQLEQEIMQFLSYGMTFEIIEKMVKNKYRGKQRKVELKMLETKGEI